MSGWSLFGLLIGLELTGLDWQTANTARARFYRAAADFVYPWQAWPTVKKSLALKAVTLD
jgi:hypothetical protein